MIISDYSFLFLCNVSAFSEKKLDNFLVAAQSRVLDARFSSFVLRASSIQYRASSSVCIGAE
jgi:hypothetical protein